MSNSSPLVPQGSLLEQQSKGRPHLRIALCIVAVHLVFLGGLLMQGCKRDEAPGAAVVEEFAPYEVTNRVAMEVEVAPTNVAPVTELPPFFPEELGLGSAETSTIALPPVEPVRMAPPAEPVRTPAPTVAVQTEATPPPAVGGMQEYTVVPGDYFIKIGRKFNVSAAAIAQANPGVESTRLQVGQKLKIPTSTAPVAAAGTSAGIYEVKLGDNLTKIAREHGTTVTALKAANNLATDQIQVGQKLKLPAGAR